MINLLRKDFMVLYKTKALYMLLALSVFGGIMLQKITFYFLWSMIMGVYFCVVYTGAYDHKYDSERVFNSFPLNRSSIVLGKYVSSLVCLLLSMIISVLTTLVVKIVNGGSAVTLNLSQIATVLLLTGIYVSVYYPIYFKVGYMHARWANIAGLVFMFSFSSIISRNDAEVQSFLAKYLGFFVDAITGNTGMNSGLVIATIATILLVLSASISIKLYNSKEF